MNENEQGHYRELFQWVKDDGTPTGNFNGTFSTLKINFYSSGIYARHQHNKARPMQHLKDGKWSQMSQKQVDKVKEGDNFKVRWFIKKETTDENGETKLGFEFLPAKSEFLQFFF